MSSRRITREEDVNLVGGGGLPSPFSSLFLLRSWREERDFLSPSQPGSPKSSFVFWLEEIVTHWANTQSSDVVWRVMRAPVWD